MSGMIINDEVLVAQVRLGALVRQMDPAEYLNFVLADYLDSTLDMLADAVFKHKDAAVDMAALGEMLQ